MDLPIDDSTSPALSASSSPQRRSKKPTTMHDPFDSIPCPNELRNRQTHPSDKSNSDTADSNSESAFTTLISAPLLFFSFLLSLAIVNRQNRSYRVAEHPPQSPQSFWARFTAPLRKWWDPEPYQDLIEATWRRKDGSLSGDDEGVPRDAKRKQRWYATKKQGKMASMEIAEAFEMVGRMKAIVAGIFVAGTVGLGLGLKMIYERLHW